MHDKHEFFSRDLRPATEHDCTGPWLCGQPGEYFRCCFCGRHLVQGDLYRVLYTNDMPDAPGNPLVCQACNDTEDVLRSRWREMHQVAATRFWWFVRRCR